MSYPPAVTECFDCSGNIRHLAFMLNPFINFFYALLDFYSLALIIYVIISLLYSFDIINRFNPFVNKVYKLLGRVIEPVLNKIRRYLPDLGGIDLSPLILFLLIRLVQDMMLTYLWNL
jgi:YggT family protein